MADIVVPVAVEVAKCLGAPVGRHCSYVIFCDRYVRQLNGEVEKLGDTRDQVQHSIDDARNNMKPIKTMVTTWVNKVEAVANEVRDVLDYDEKAKKTCFYGWLPNPKARYHLGKKASRTVKVIQALIAGGQFERVYDENLPPGLVDGASDVNSSAGDGGNTMLKSQASTFQDVMKALNDEKHKVIGVYGPGGVGKTTLLEIVEEKLNKEGGPFDMIVKSKVSQTQDLTKIQFDIAYALGLKDLKDEPSEAGRRDLLFKRLQKNPREKVLIILDDLWAELDLKAIGIPLGNESMKCKLLLASRDKRVLEQRMHADQTFHLNSLEEDEAFKLFEKIVGDKLRDDEELKVKAAQVVTKLAGLPLLINSVASTLKCSDVSTWEDMLIKIEDPHIERIVKWSYDHLESEEAKCLFLLCGLIGETIEVELLLGLGMGLGLFRGFDNKMQNSRNRLNTMLNSLHSFCLLQDGGDGQKYVTIHDLYSEMVVSDAFSGQNSLMINKSYGLWPKEKLEKCWACLVNVGSDRLVELMLRRYPHVKILMLSKQYDRGDCSRMDFTHMEELRALYLCSMRITSLPSSMEILGNLQSLIINCHVKDVANLGKLKALQILNFERSTISRLPKEIGKLTNLRSLNLNHCYWLKIIEPGALKGLINLEELHMKESFNQWMSEHEIPLQSCVTGLAELKSLTKLASLEISILRPVILLEDGGLPFENLDKFWIKIGHGAQLGYHLKSDAELGYGLISSAKLGYGGLKYMNLNLEGRDSILSIKWVKKNLQEAQYLCLSELSEFKESPRELCTQGFREVKDLIIKDSPSIKYIANSSNGSPLTFFGKLESFFLTNLINLEKICNGPIASKCFNKLKVVSVKQCDRLEYLWCFSNMRRLVHLEEIEVWKCDSMQSIVTHDAGEDIVSTNNKVELPNVRRLVLSELPNMTSFCTKVEIASEDIPIQVPLPRLESLVMVGLLGLEKILYSEHSLKYSNLKSLEIKKSKSTSIILKDWILKLPNLESMKIVGTPSVEVVFDLEELKVIKEVEILSRLSTLELSKLPNLRCMWKQDVQLQGISILQNLKKLFINNTGLSFLFPLSVAKCLREIRNIRVVNCPNMKAVIVYEEGRDDGTNGIIEFPLLERLSISCCPMEKFFSYPHGKKESITATSDSQDNYSDSFFDQKISLPSLKKLKINSVGSLTRIWHSELPKISFDKLAKFTREKCSNLLDVFPSTITGRLRNLEMVKVSKCPSLESLFDFGSLDSYKEQTIVLLPQLKEVQVSSCPSLESLFNWGPLDSSTEYKIVLLPKLENVVVSGAGKLRHVVMRDSQTVLGFPSLGRVHVLNCSELRYLFPNYTATTLEKLRALLIYKCEQMEEVVPKEEGGRSKAKVMSFLSLIELNILWCPNFRAFIWSPTSVERQLGEMIEENDELPQPLFNDMVRFPNLKKLYIGGVRCKELWNNQISNDSFCNLETLLLKGCDNLQRIAPSDMWNKLQDCLETLEVKSCRSIEIIYKSDGTVAKSGNLRNLDLCDLDNLRHIWRYDNLPNIPFPNLRYIKVVRCSRLDMLFATFTTKFLGQIKKLVVESCEDMKLIAGHEECEEVTGKTITFSGLTTLRLYDLPKFRSFLPEKYHVEFPSLDVLSGTEPDRGILSAEESEGKIEESDCYLEILEHLLDRES